jgi:hypothetical protein
MRDRNKSAAISLSLLLLTGCATATDELTSNRNSTDTAGVQSFLRETALENWESTDVKYADIDASISNPPALKDTKGPLSDADFNLWKADMLDTWKELKTKEQLNLMCQFWYEGWLDSDQSFSKHFTESRNQLLALGLIVESIDEIRILEDNRNSIFYPRQGQPFTLFKCGATVVYKLERGVFAPPADSTIAFIYWLNNGKVESTFQVHSNDK